jgi:hypothetical protein
MTPEERAKVRARLLTVTPKQERAIEALVAGATHAEAAEAADVDRKTITRWKGYHPGFQARLSASQAVVAAEQLDKVRRIRARALDVIAAKLDDDSTDIATALTVLSSITSDTAKTWTPPAPEGLLDAAMNSTRHNLPPTPPPRSLDEQLSRLEYGVESDVERAERATIERLAVAAGIDEAETDDPEDQP